MMQEITFLKISCPKCKCDECCSHEEFYCYKCKKCGSVFGCF